ncbi:VOC family protein [Nitratireductor soli]|uniref:VOC family protein n=1 Tax=Nitratireductor soli TaxID=1670619 RepID=UPI00065DBD01|nr:VOC family protein [Nitratireductor soli]
MLKTKEPRATIAVSDIAAARAFYEQKLGLEPEAISDMPMVVYPCGVGALFVYQSPTAGSNTATGVTWIVGDDVAEVAAGLAGKGVAFESYDMPEATKDGDVYTMGDIRIAWFKDPDGNIHAIVNG